MRRQSAAVVVSGRSRRWELNAESRAKRKVKHRPPCILLHSQKAGQRLGSSAQGLARGAQRGGRVVGHRRQAQRHRRPRKTQTPTAYNPASDQRTRYKHLAEKRGREEGGRLPDQRRMARENIGARKPGIFAHVFACPPTARERQMTLPLKLAQTFRLRLGGGLGLGRTSEERRVASAPPTSLYDAPYPLPCSEQLAEATQCHNVAPTAVRAAPPAAQVRERKHGSRLAASVG